MFQKKQTFHELWMSIVFVVHGSQRFENAFKDWVNLNKHSVNVTGRMFFPVLKG